jgi:hypothetical protein
MLNKIMRIEKDNLISFSLTMIMTPFYAIWFFLKWIGSQIIDIISMIFNSFKLQLAKLLGGVILVIIISWVL